MTKTRSAAWGLTLILGGAAGCAGTPAEPPAAAPATGDAVAASVRQAWQAARTNLTGSAEALTEADYGFRPVDTVRTYGQILTHIAGANYVFCSAARGEASPHAESAFEETVTTREAIIATLAESLTYCDAAYDAATDVTLAESITLPFGQGTGARALALVGNIGHLNEHYGNLVTYMRIRGVVPPSSR
ncbi:MAG TPA: DinB family protein [Vicinamibacterales bacterium]|nr:DinB family protein [Vicinamibacterales bacterium]